MSKPHRPSAPSVADQAPAGLAPPPAAASPPDSTAPPADVAPSSPAPPRCEKHDVPCVVGSKTSNYTEFRCPVSGCKTFHRRLPANLERALSRGRRRT